MTFVFVNAITGDTGPWQARVDLPTLVASGPHARVFFEEAVVARQSPMLPQSRRVDIPEAGTCSRPRCRTGWPGVLAEFADRDLAG